MNLRHYQSAAADAVLSDIAAGGKSGIVVHCTGSGKSVTIAEIAQRYLAQYHKPILVICHRRRLIDQLTKTIGEFTGHPVAVEMSEQRAHDTLARVTVASVPSLALESRRKRYHAERFGLVIVDEGHRSSASGHMAILDHFPNAYRLGFTATPDRADDKSLPFDKVLHEYRLTTAIEEGFLAPVKAELIPVKIDLRKAKVRAGDFADTDLDALITPYLEVMAREIASRKGKHMVFLPLVKTSKAMADILNGLGVRTLHLDGTSQDVDEGIAAYERGEYDCLTNALLFVEGVDIPCVDHITMLRPTKSRVLYCQAIGRGTRLHPGKSHLTVLDPLWTTKRHKLCRPAHLVTDDEKVIEVMERKFVRSGGMSPVEELEESTAQAERESSLAREMKANSHRQREWIDPLTMKDYAPEGYQPRHEWQNLPSTEHQKQWLKKQGIDPDITRGMAHYIMEMVIGSDRATPDQERVLRGWGRWRDGMSKKDATILLDKLFSKRKS